MRSVLSISMPEAKKIELERRAKKANMSVSLYVVNLLDLESHMISEDELLERAKRAEENYKSGKTKVLNSLADLIK